MSANKRTKWTDEMLRLEARKYGTKDEFQKGNNAAYQAARRRGKQFVNDICSHMPKRKNISGDNNPNFKWSDEMLALEALKYLTIGEFQIGSPSAYVIAWRRGIIKQICSHMPEGKNILGSNNPNYQWTDEELHIEALKYDTIVDFQYGSGAAYQAAWGRGILTNICSHMKSAHGSSREEKAILKGVKEFFPEAKKKRAKKISIAGKPHIKMFELDIFVPKLNIAIEYDGDYWHSYEAMKKQDSKKKWPDEDIWNYHEIKDEYFSSIGIKILRIKECDWKDSRPECIARIEKFLGITGFMSEPDQKVA